MSVITVILCLVTFVIALISLLIAVIAFLRTRTNTQMIITNEKDTRTKMSKLIADINDVNELEYNVDVAQQSSINKLTK